MKKLITMAVAATLLVSLAACGSSTPAPSESAAPSEVAVSETPASEAPVSEAPAAEGAYKDGTYTASEADFDDKGYKAEVSITVAGGAITEVTYNAVTADGKDKITESAPGGSYDMSKAGATLTWAEQSALLCQYLVETQDPNAINLTDAEGHTDSVAGVSIKVAGFVDLANEALSTAK